MEFGILSAEKFHDQITGYCTHNGHFPLDKTNNNAMFLEDLSKNILEYLNDDCLRSVFRNIHRLVNFCAVANVCKRFNAIALEIFSLKIKQNTFDLNQFIVNGDVRLQQLEKFLAMFGASIHAAYLNFNDVRIENTSKVNLVLKMINNYCKNLRSLDIRINNDNKNDWVEIGSVLPMLKYLKIQFCNKNRIKVFFDAFTDFISACCLLETLIIDGGWSDFTLFTLPKITFPKLVKFKLFNYDPHDLVDFLRHNTQLEKIKCFSFDYCAFIGSNMLNLRELSLQGGRIVDDDVFQSKSLGKNVKIRLGNLMTDGDDVENVCQIKNITTYRAEVWTPFGANHLISLAQRHNQLKKLTLIILDPKIRYPIDMIKPMLSYADQLAEIKIICRNTLRIRFNEKDFEEILGVIERRKNSIKLNINISHNCIFNSTHLSGKWEKEKMIIFSDKSNHLNVISHYVMPSYYY